MRKVSGVQTSLVAEWISDAEAAHNLNYSSTVSTGGGGGKNFLLPIVEAIKDKEVFCGQDWSVLIILEEGEGHLPVSRMIFKSHGNFKCCNSITCKTPKLAK